MGIFGKSSTPAVGIDISTSAVKVLEMTKGRGSYKVTRYGFEPLPRNVVVEHAITDIEVVADAVQKAVKRSGTRRKHAVVAVASSHVITRVVTIPADLKDSEVEEQVNLEADHQIPYALDEVNMDFEVLGRAPGDNATDNEVQITACRKEIVDDWVSVVEGAGLKVAVVDVDSYAVSRALKMFKTALPDSGKDKVIAVLDYGDTTTHLDVMYNDRLIYSRDHSFGGKILTENIRTRFGISYHEAEAAKQSGDLPENYRTDILEPFKEAMGHEAVRAVQFFTSSSRKFEGVDHLLIAGGCARIPQIADIISAHSGLNATVVNPFANVGSAMSVSKDRLKSEGPMLLKACGLAMRGG